MERQLPLQRRVVDVDAVDQAALEILVHPVDIAIHGTAIPHRLPVVDIYEHGLLRPELGDDTLVLGLRILPRDRLYTRSLHPGVRRFPQ